MTGTWFDLKGGLRNRDGGDGGGTRVVTRAQFWGKIGMGMRGGGAPKLI
jgi:hypothetical protein